MQASVTGYVCSHCGEPIATEYWAKPIPSRKSDWEAYCDAGCIEENTPVGRGVTEKDALLSLHESEASHAS